MTGSPLLDNGNSGAPARVASLPREPRAEGGAPGAGTRKPRLLLEGEPAVYSGARSCSRLGMIRKPDLEAKPLGGEELCNTPFQSLAF